MQGWVGVLPLLTAALAATIPPAPQGAWSPQELVDLFNALTAQADSLYRLVETGASNEPTSPRRIRFLMKETECQKSELKENIEDCKFKEGGVTPDCTAYLDRGTSKDEILLGCNMVNRRHKRQIYSLAWNCRRRIGCFSIIGHDVPVNNKPGSLSDLVKEDLEGMSENFGGLVELHETPGKSPSHDSALDENANFRPVEEIDQTYGGISLGDSDHDKEEFGIVKENRSPSVELPDKARTRRRRAWPWLCPGCFSLIGLAETDREPLEEPTLFPSLVEDSGIIESFDWDLPKKDSPRFHSLFTGDETKNV